MSKKSERPLGKLTIQVWLLYDRPNFKYLNIISGTELGTNGQADKHVDRQTIQTLESHSVGIARYAVSILQLLS